jgi:purine-nucleoside phosphorylase
VTGARAEEAAAFLTSRGFDGRFALAIVLGTGLRDLADALDEPVSVAYADIPHFPAGCVSGHAGRLLGGRLEGQRVLLLQGRAHYYETGDPAAMRVPIGVVRALSAPPLLLTNASGSTDPSLRPGSLVALSDHINFSGLHPLSASATRPASCR